MTSLEKTLRWIVLGGVFLLPFVPLIVADGIHFPYNLFFPYITGKNFAFRLIVEIMAGAWLALALVNVKYRPRRSWVLGAFSLFVLVMAAADLFGANPFKSIWSNFERMDGWITLIHVLIYTIIAGSMLATEKMWRRLFWVSLAVSAYLSLYGFLQIAGFTALSEGGAAGLGARIDATFGNPIYLAAYLLFHIFIAAMLWAQMWSERRKGDRLALSLLYGAIIVLETFALLFTGTRGTTIGLVGGALVTAVLVLIQASNSRTAWRMSIGAVVAILVASAGFWAVRDTSFVHRVGFLERIASISLQDNTVKARFINWSIAWQGVKERPVLGWGQENYALVFDKYYDPRMYAQEPWFDRVHNIVFDWLVAGGFLGLLTYLSIFGAALYALWRKGFSIPERSILTGLLAAYFCHNFFVFDNVTSYILFGTVLAYIMYRSSEATGAQPVLQRGLLPESALPYAALVSALLIWGVAWGVNGNALTANRMLLESLQPQSAGLMTNLSNFEETIALHTYGTQEAREQLSQGAAQIAGSPTISADIKKAFADATVRELKAQAAESPLDARFPLFLGVAQDAFGDYANAAVSLQKAHELSPKKQSIYFELAQNAQLRGDTSAALGFFKSAFELETDYNDARFYYAAALIRAGQDGKAQELIAPLIPTGEAADQRILAAYVAKKEYIKAAPLWKAHIAAKPDDAQAYFTLAAIYYEAGDKVNAIAALEAAKLAIPGVATQADPLIRQIQNGTVQM